MLSVAIDKLWLEHAQENTCIRVDRVKLVGMVQGKPGQSLETCSDGDYQMIRIVRSHFSCSLSLGNQLPKLGIKSLAALAHKLS